jgi:D-sorbitol dehydrogenase (acceptor)
MLQTAKPAHPTEKDNEMAQLQGKIALLTGAGRGIGAALAAGLAREGATVCVADIAEDQAKKTAAEIGGDAFGLPVDVGDPESIRTLVDRIIRLTGRIDILVNNAGVFGAQPWFDITPEEFDRVFSINVRGLLLVTQAVAAHMTAARSGSIINLASGAGRRGNPVSVVYSASKTAVISLTQSAALAFADKGVRVNAIAPGGVLTPMWTRVDADYSTARGQPTGSMSAAFTPTIPLGRMGTPEDYVGVATFLASDASAYMTGQTLNVDGGLFLN